MIPGHPTLKLEPFAGPLDLLLHLIQENALDISVVAISQITDKYLEMLLMMQELDFDMASEFLVMAATLVMLKSRALLPRPEDAVSLEGEADVLSLTQEQLLQRLAFKKAILEKASLLAQRNLLGQDVFERQNPAQLTHKVLKGLHLTELILAYQEVLVRSKRRFTVLRKETVSILDKIRDFKNFDLGQWLAFETLMVRGRSVSERVATFLAILELCRLKKSVVVQEKTYEAIFVKILEHFEENLDGFASDFREMVGSS
jgi:segregation and condensation protein A